MPPVDAAGDDLVVGLKQDGAVLEVLEEGLHDGFDVQRVEPESEDARFALALGVKIFNLGLLFLGDGVQAGVCVEQVGHESEVELWVTRNKRCRGQELAAVKGIGVLEYHLGAL